MQSNGGRQTLHRAGTLLRRAASAGAGTPSAAVRAYSSTHPLNERIVVAVGGNALQRRGERLSEL